MSNETASAPTEQSNSFLETTEENRQLNQYWYSKHSIETICNAIREGLELIKGKRVAFLSTPSLFFSLSGRRSIHGLYRFFNNILRPQTPLMHHPCRPFQRARGNTAPSLTLTPPSRVRDTTFMTTKIQPRSATSAFIHLIWWSLIHPSFLILSGRTTPEQQSACSRQTRRTAHWC